MFDMFSARQREAERLREGEITEDEYNAWRYTYPRIEAERTKTALDELRRQKDSGL
jgi:hypothetical protein